MKKVVYALLVLSILAIMVSACVPEFQNASKKCKWLGDNFYIYGVSHGACVSWLEAENYSAIAAALCNNDQFLDDWGPFDNHGACVGAVKAFFE